MAKPGSLGEVGKYLGVAFLLPISTAVGYGMGYLLDKLFHTHFLWAIFGLFGVAAGFIELFRELDQDSQLK